MAKPVSNASVGRVRHHATAAPAKAAVAYPAHEPPWEATTAAATETTAKANASTAFPPPGRRWDAVVARLNLTWSSSASRGGGASVRKRISRYAPGRTPVGADRDTPAKRRGTGVDGRMIPVMTTLPPCSG
ncbi:hypothetical protein GCM10009565_42870 [Amycolatopsis albidoflavus]